MKNQFILLHLNGTGKEILVNLSKVYDMVSFEDRRSAFTRIFYDLILRNGQRNVNEVYVDVSECIAKIVSMIPS